MDPYQTPGAVTSPEAARADLPMVRYARVVLAALAALNGLFSLAIPPAYYAMAVYDPEIDPEFAPMMAAAGVCVALVVIVIAVVPMIAAAIGLARGAKWAWYVTVVVGAMYVPSLCLPVGAFLVYAMVNDEVRRAFLD